MKTQASLFLILALLLGVESTRCGWLGWVPGWLALDFLLVAGAYFARCARIFGKRPDGVLPAWSWCLFLPFFCYTAAVWNLLRWCVREAPWNETDADLVLGRRLLGRDLPPGLANFVDLTAEFQAPRACRELPGYVSFPILDSGAPDPVELGRVLRALKPGRTYVHCAQGHGRTALFAVAFVLAAGGAGSVDEALHRLRAFRPRLCLNRDQRRCAEAFARMRPAKGGEA